MASDACSTRLFEELQTLLPNLKSCSLDAMHLCFKVDHHTKKHGVRCTTIGLVLRSIMTKFNIPYPVRRRDALYRGERIVGLTSAEQGAIDHIRRGDLPRAEANRVLVDMNPNVAMQSLSEFAELLSAVVVLFPERMDVSQGKATLRQVFVHACSPERFQWYLNNVRCRSALPAHRARLLAAGTDLNMDVSTTLRKDHRPVFATFRLSGRSADGGDPPTLLE